MSLWGRCSSTDADGLVPHAHSLRTGVELTVRKPHEDLSVAQGKAAGVDLFILAITLHNIPEGLAVGVGFGAPPATRSRRHALSLCLLGISIPEGLAVSVAAINAGRSVGSTPTFWDSPGVVAFSLACSRRCRRTIEPLLPYRRLGGRDALAISDDSPRDAPRGYERVATLGLMTGVIGMLI